MGHAVITDASGQIVEAWGNPDEVILPRSSCKMVQALPLITSGAADRYHLTEEHLALACASHQGAAMHTDRVQAWLADLDLGNDDLCCGPQMPNDEDAKIGLLKSDTSPCRYHNNCSGKHAGFLTVNTHLGLGPDYVDPKHPLQVSVREAIEDLTGMDSPGYGIDGCSAPNFATTVQGLARAMAQFASPGSDATGKAAERLTSAMMRYPELVAGTTRSCTELMQAMGGRVAIKTGAEAVFVSILPEKGLGVALKIADGATRASECAIAAILVKLGVLDPNHPATQKRLNAPIPNWDGIETGRLKSLI
jgi:L-asparaginase II